MFLCSLVSCVIEANFVMFGILALPARDTISITKIFQTFLVKNSNYVTSDSSDYYLHVTTRETGKKQTKKIHQQSATTSYYSYPLHF